MRLIDADKLRDKCDEYDWDTIDNEPTVEAVPIEWIREWYTKHSPLIGSYVAYMLLDWQAENEHNKGNASQTD